MFNDAANPRWIAQVVSKLAIAVPFEAVGQIQPGELLAEARGSEIVNGLHLH
jgi:hypothetical protein